MKAIGVIDLQSILDSDLVWRRREISSLVTLAKGSPAHLQHSLVRASVPILYAHWEGFGRECFLRYLEFVAFRKVRFKQLDPAFLYLASISSLAAISQAGVKQALEIIQGLVLRNEAVNKDNFRKKISTKSNLRADVLRDLLLSCGLDYAWCNVHENFIDKEICDPRNEIAHGGGAAPSLEQFIVRRDKTFSLMTNLQMTVINAAASGSYSLAKKAA